MKTFIDLLKFLTHIVLFIIVAGPFIIYGIDLCTYWMFDIHPFNGSIPLFIGSLIWFLGTLNFLVLMDHYRGDYV